MKLRFDEDKLNDSMSPGLADRGRFEDDDRPRAGVCHFGNKADQSKTSQHVETDDSSQIGGAGSLIARDGGTANQSTTLFNSTTDLGAIEAGLMLGSEAIEANQSSFSELLSSHSEGLTGFLGSLDSMLGFASDSQKAAALSTKEATSLVAAAYQGSQDSSDGNRTVVLVGLSVVGLIAAAMIFKGMK